MHKLLSFAILLLLLSCDRPNKDTYFNHAPVDRISKLTNIDPPPSNVSFPPVFVLSKDDSVIVTSFVLLKRIYSSSFTESHKSYTAFLYDVLNQKLKLSLSDPMVVGYSRQVFKLDSAISALHKNEGVNGLIKRFVVWDKDSYALEPTDLSMNAINSISYYFFIHQFLRLDDDYYATSHFYKLSDILWKQRKN